MATISASFTNNYGQSRKWTIWDTGIDPTAPKLLFDDYLDDGASTGAMAFAQDDGGVFGHASYKRSDGAETNLDVTDQQNVSMQ